jgi:glycosyltransferase involved in cell wall biosynthesis
VTTVDVVIPVRDGELFLPACLDSVLAQTFPVNRIFVVDDGSADRTPAITTEYAARDPRIQAIRSKPNGVSSARNLGIRASSAEFVGFLDSDDLWRPEKIARQMALFAKAPAVGWVHCGYSAVDERGVPINKSPVYAPSKRGHVLSDLLGGYPLAGSASAVVARRRLLIEVGGFDETLAHAEDFDLWAKLASISELDYVPDALTAIREHAGSVQRRPDPLRIEKDFVSRLRVHEKWIAAYPFNQTLLEIFRADALHVGFTRVMSRFQFGFYDVMRKQAPEATKLLFPSAVDYRRGLRAVIVPKLRWLFAQKLILRSPLLLRCCQMFGRLKGLQVERR